MHRQMGNPEYEIVDNRKYSQKSSEEVALLGSVDRTQFLWYPPTPTCLFISRWDSWGWTIYKKWRSSIRLILRPPKTPPNATVFLLYIILHNPIIHDHLHSPNPLHYTIDSWSRCELEVSSRFKMYWYNTNIQLLCVLVHTNLGPTPRNNPAIPSVL